MIWSLGSHSGTEGTAVGYGVIHDTIFDSSVADDWRARVVLQDMVVLANEVDDVMMTQRRFVRRSGLPEEIAAAGIEILEAPDPLDKSGNEDGRRILPILNKNGIKIGWHVVNRAHWKRLMAAKWRKQYRAEWMRKYRASLKVNPRLSQEEISSRASEAGKALDEVFGPVEETE